MVTPQPQPQPQRQGRLTVRELQACRRRAEEMYDEAMEAILRFHQLHLQAEEEGRMVQMEEAQHAQALEAAAAMRAWLPKERCKVCAGMRLRVGSRGLTD